MENFERKSKPDINGEDTDSIRENENNIASDTTSTPPSFQGDNIEEVNLLNLSAKWSFYNITLLGVIFMTIFTAYQTCAMIQVLVLEGANKETNNTAGNGYTSLSIVYGSFSISNWLSASVVELVTSKWSMFLGAATYSLFLALFLTPNHILLYFSSALMGFGAAILWAGQGKFLSINSTEQTMSRNTNIFWALFQSSLIWGNLIVIFEFSNTAVVTAPTRTKLFTILTSVSCVGFLAILFLRNRKVQNGLDGNCVRNVPNPWTIIKNSFRMLFSKKMLLLSVIMLYTGLELSFVSALVTSVGHMEYFKNEAKKLAGLCGLFIGIGQISSSFIFAFLSSLRRVDRRLVLVVGFVCHVVCYFFVFLTFPSLSPISETSAMAYWFPSEKYIFVCSFLLGFGDSCFNTQIYPVLRDLYYENISSACSLFKFIQSLACAVCFAYSRYVIMEVHLFILCTFLTIGVIFFIILETRRINRSGYYQIN